jgi:Protein of unknown function (DUF1573)
VLRRVPLMSVLVCASVLFGAAPALAALTLQPAPINQAPLKPRATFVKPSLEEVEFGAVDIHASDPQQAITFGNSYPKPVQEKIHSVEIVGKGASSFQLVGNGCSGAILIRNPESCTVEVSFDPGAPVARSATLKLVVEDVAEEEGEETEVLEEIEVPLSGEGIVGTLTPSESPLSFSPIPYTGSGSHGEGSQNETEEIKISDETKATANIESVGIVGPNASSYSIQWGNCEHDYFQPGNYCTMGIRFEPNSLGANDAQLVIESDASNNPLTIPLEGEGLHGPKISLSSTQALLGEVTLGSSAWHTFTLTNTGDYPLGVQQAFLVSGTPLMFPVLTDTCSGQEIDPGASCALTVGFQPTTPGEKDASVVIITSSALPVSVVGIDGIGVQPAVAPGAVAPWPVSPAASTSPAQVQVIQPVLEIARPGGPVTHAGPTPPRRPAKGHLRHGRPKGSRLRDQQRVAAARNRRRVIAARRRRTR